MAAAEVNPSGDPRFRQLLFVALLLVLVEVVLTCRPVFDLLQLEPDDYRYLALVQKLESDFAANIGRAVVVENRWDHLWWMDASASVRFFRPTVVLSFWLDSLVHGSRIDGLLMTNVLLHLACSLLATIVLFRLVGSGLPALLGSLLFAAFACHAETIWYVSGRTDTLAVVGFLAGLALHMHAGELRPRLRFAALPFFAFAIVSKELAAALPVICLAYDRWIEKRAPSLLALLRRDAWLYSAYVAIGLGYALVRGLFVAGEGSFVFPYFVSPLSSSFPAHLLAQVRNYSENLFFGESTKPFLQPEELAEYSSTIGLLVSLTGIVGLALLLRRDLRFGVLLLLALLTWLPTCFVYVSERYLYLPSLAVAGALSLALARLRAGAFYWILVALACAWILSQARLLERKNRGISGVPRPALAIQALIQQKLTPPPGSRILFLNFPSDWVHAQFLEDQLRVNFGDPSLTCRVLTLMPGKDERASPPLASSEDPKTIRVHSDAPLLDRKNSLFPWIRFLPGTRIERPALGFSVEVLAGDGESCTALRFELAEPIDRYLVLRFHPTSGDYPSPGLLIWNGQIEVVRVR